MASVFALPVIGFVLSSLFHWGWILLIGCGVGYWSREASVRRASRLAASAGVNRLSARAVAPAVAPARDLEPGAKNESVSAPAGAFDDGWR